MRVSSGGDRTGSLSSVAKTVYTDGTVYLSCESSLSIPGPGSYLAREHGLSLSSLSKQEQGTLVPGVQTGQEHEFYSSDLSTRQGPLHPALPLSEPKSPPTSPLHTSGITGLSREALVKSLAPWPGPDAQILWLLWTPPSTSVYSPPTCTLPSCWKNQGLLPAERNGVCTLS